MSEGTVMLCSSLEQLSNNACGQLTTSYEPRIMVRDKHNQRYALWLYEPKDWEGDTLYTNNFEIIAWAYTWEERDALNATVEYHTNLMKENENA